MHVYTCTRTHVSPVLCILGLSMITGRYQMGASPTFLTFTAVIDCPDYFV